VKVNPELSGDFCRVITFLTEKCQVAMIHFDADAELLEGFNVMMGFRQEINHLPDSFSTSYER
jgi:hypothetical protein